MARFSSTFCSSPENPAAKEKAQLAAAPFIQNCKLPLILAFRLQVVALLEAMAGSPVVGAGSEAAALAGLRGEVVPSPICWAGSGRPADSLVAASPLEQASPPVSAAWCLRAA